MNQTAHEEVVTPETEGQRMVRLSEEEMQAISSLSSFVKVITAIFITVAAAGFIGVGTLLFSTREDLIELRSEVRNLSNQMAVGGRYTAEMASRDRELYQQQFKTLAAQTAANKDEMREMWRVIRDLSYLVERQAKQTKDKE